MLNLPEGGGKPIHLLVDNGSLRPEATLSLRRLSAELGREAGVAVHPVSLLHANRVSPSELGGQPAATFEPFLRRMIEQSQRHFRVVPLFFGPSRALTEFIPEKVGEMQREAGDLRVEVTPCLCPGDAQSDQFITTLLADAVRETVVERGLAQPRVALVDHGSPIEPVTQVRNRLAAVLADQLGECVAAVSPCSMERRDGPAHAFNEPLLEKLLRQPGWRDGPVVVAMLFLQPGRHAGEGGDVATICAGAEAEHPKLRTCRTPLVGEHPGLLKLLARRLKDKSQSLPV